MLKACNDEFTHTEIDGKQESFAKGFNQGRVGLLIHGCKSNQPFAVTEENSSFSLDIPESDFLLRKIADIPVTVWPRNEIGEVHACDCLCVCSNFQFELMRLFRSRRRIVLNVSPKFRREESSDVAL